jgi:hypothetical protein
MLGEDSDSDDDDEGEEEDEGVVVVVVVVVVGDGMWRVVGSSSVMDVTVELPSGGGASAEDIDAPDDDAYESITCSPVVALCPAQHQA